MSVRVVLVDDQALIRAGFKAIIDSAPDLEVVGEADDGGLGAALEHLRSLSPAQAEVIALRVIVGMSAEEVGELTGQSAGAVRVMAHRGLAVLRQRLTQDDELGQPTQIESSGVTNDDQHTIDGVQ